MSKWEGCGWYRYSTSFEWIPVIDRLILFWCGNGWCSIIIPIFQYLSYLSSKSEVHFFRPAPEMDSYRIWINQVKNLLNNTSLIWKNPAFPKIHGGIPEYETIVTKWENVLKRPNCKAFSYISVFWPAKSKYHTWSISVGHHWKPSINHKRFWVFEVFRITDNFKWVITSCHKKNGVGLIFPD